MALHCEFAKMKKDPGMLMSRWITAVRDVVHQIKDLKGNVLDEDIMVVLTGSLPDAYTPLVVQLDAVEESARTIRSVITCLIGEEHCQAGEKSGDQGDDVLAFYAPSKKHKVISKITCFGCGVKGHYKSDCPVKEKMEMLGKPAEAKARLY
jgi:hypothetical protein